MTPNLALIRIEAEHAWVPLIPLPLFLLWIPAILLAPILLVTLWIVCLVVKVPFWRTIRVCWDLLCALPGTNVRVCAEGKRITVRIL